MKLWHGLEILGKALALPSGFHGRFDQMPRSTSIDQVLLACHDPQKAQEFTDQFGSLEATQDPMANDWKLMKNILQKYAEFASAPKKPQ